MENSVWPYNFIPYNVNMDLTNRLNRILSSTPMNEIENSEGIDYYFYQTTDSFATSIQQIKMRPEINERNARR